MIKNPNVKAFLMFFNCTILLPLVIALCTSFAFPHVNGVFVFLGLCAFSVLYDSYYKKVKNYKLMKTFTETYSKLPYKKYMIPLTCQACGQKNIAEIDLDKNTEFVCSSCSKKNAIYVQFTTAIAAKHEKL